MFGVVLMGVLVGGRVMGREVTRRIGLGVAVLVSLVAIVLTGACGDKGGAPVAGVVKSFKASATLSAQAAEVLDLVSVEGQKSGPAVWILVKVKTKPDADPAKTWINYKDAAGTVNSISTQGTPAGSEISVEIPCPDESNAVGEIVSVTARPINPP